MQLEQTIVATCENCDKAAQCVAFWSPKSRMILCHDCLGQLMFLVTEVMLPVIADRLEQRRQKL